MPVRLMIFQQAADTNGSSGVTSQVSQQFTLSRLDQVDASSLSLPADGTSYLADTRSLCDDDSFHISPQGG